VIIFLVYLTQEIFSGVTMGYRLEKKV
jgi:hypothetical protein